MELDDLKGAWEHQSEHTAKLSLSEDALLTMLHVKANSAIDLLKRSVRFELWFTVIFIIICLLTSIKTDNKMLQNSSLMTSFISFGFAIFYYKKLSLLNNINVKNKSIKTNITNLLTQFEKFLFFYRWGYNVLFPVALTAGAFIGLHVSTDNNLILYISNPKLWLLLFITLAPLTLFFNFGIKWYLRKLYGDHLSKLRFLLIELND